MLSELQQCLTLLKQALHCPICLDDLKSPVITPCAHIFCSFCITKHISSKRTVKCPLCNKQVTRRALKAADKFKEIAAVSEEIFTNFANESSMAFVPVVKIGSLHLSQEMSQAPLEVVEKKTEKLFRQPHTRPRRNSTLLKRSVRGAPQNGNRLVVSLGTSARVHKHKLLMSSLSNSAKTDEFAEATQPMYGEVEPTEDAAASTQPMRTNEVDLFAFTQSPQKPAADDTLTEFPLPSPTKSAGEDSSGENVAQECDRLRQECADLEAEVAQLQQQLEAEALSPNETLKLLASAGTEPQDLDFIAPLPKHQPTEVDSVREKADSIVPAPTSPDLSITRVSGPHDSDMDLRAPDASDLDAVDMIPSSQLEESMGELDTTEEAKTAASVLQDRPVFLSNRSASDCVTINKDDVGSALSRVTRVENSQTNNTTTTSQNSSSSFLPLPVHTKPSPHLTQLQGPNVCVDTIPFTPPTGTQAAQMSSLIEDTENAAPGDTAKVQHPAIYITGSNLSSVELNSLRRFCRQFNAVEDSRFVPGRTTHVVVATETFRPRVAQRTFKYFMGILHRAWIVNTAWIRKCLLANALLNEESFEIQGDTVCGDCHEGPRRGRLKVPAFPSDPDPLRQVKDPSLVDRRPFSGLSLCPFGNLGALTKKDFAALVEGGGGTVISDPALFPAPTSVASDSKRRRALCNMILTSPSPQVDPTAYEELSKHYGVPVVNISWLLNCVSVYRRLPISKIYVIHPSPA
nr:unnamed protein product [Spirometra erinaceieuropaei]